MNDSSAVGVVECPSDIARKPEGLVHRKLTLTVQPLPKALPLHERHDVEERSVRLSRIEEGQDVRVLEVGRGLDLGQEAVCPHGRGQLGPEDLDGYLSFMPEVVCQVDRCHPARTDLALDPVAVL